ncbi:EAL and HDOD domain-containing protein [Echinimonas agarilytica]|uniref:HDOD domain-containing protein n=1 Tax=Echinimonas agarilytica TaxID=1215918 RepID=A0AA41W9K6_9GAMM|nr:HDOD domain-containing protein [Echinimonas agarilytica]MCM2680661.1 HDOD domain-containing protein [Echinimonas agarilytica]
MFIYVARQPIIDRDKNLLGYELLFRDSLKNAFPNINSHEATSKLVTGSHLHLGLESLTGPYPAFINFPELSLLIKVPELLPKDQVVIELLEEIEPSSELVETCRQLKSKGYRIALDDFAYKPEWRQVLPYVDIIKVDIRISSAKEIFEIKKLKLEYDIELLAEKVETHEEYQKMYDMGFKYFQGYFFSRPEVIQKRSINPSQLNLLELLSKLAQPDCDFDELHEIIQRDVSLTYKLLRFVNSSFFNFQKEITSIKQALVYLGEAEIRKFLALIAAAKLGENKPEELIKLAITRARFSELVALKIDQKDAPQAFLTGLLSLIGAILDEPLDEVMEKLPLSGVIKKAVVHGDGTLGQYLSIAQQYERAEWSDIAASSRALGIEQDVLPESYLSATDWSLSLLQNSNVP